MAVRFARGGGGCMAFLGRSPRAVMGALLVIAALLVVAAMHRRPPPAAALGPRCAPAVGRGGPVNHSVPVIYRTRAQYCADISARPSASGAFSRVPIEGPPAYWFVPPVPDFLDMNAAARGGWGNDLPQFYSIFSDVFRDSPADAVMIDVGANIGLTSLRVAALGRTVLAVEPVPSNLRALALSVCANDFEGRFTLVAAAAGATDSTTRIYVPKGRADNTALSECVSTANVGGTADAIDVAVVSLDSLLRTIAPAAAVREALIARVHLFKIDVQVRRCLLRWLWRVPACVVLLLRGAVAGAPASAREALSGELCRRGSSRP